MRLALVSRAADAGLELRDPYRFDSEGRSFLPQIQRTPTFRPKDLAKQVDAEIFEMMRETGAAAFSIDVEEIRILEELTVGQLETDAAREFLDKIPSVDQLLPLPAGAKRKEISA